MTVGIVIPSYRRPDALIRCLEGILAGTRLPDEIVVVLRDVDTESQKGFADWLREGKLEGAGIEVRRPIADHPGQIVAMNFGLEAASADVVCFIDDDCVPREEWLERLVKHYDRPEVGGVGGRDVVHEYGEVLSGRVTRVGELRWYGRMIGNHHLDLEPIRRAARHERGRVEVAAGSRSYDSSDRLSVGEAIEADHLKGANMSFRRALMRPFDERMSGGSSCLNDTDASLHVRGQGYTLIYDPAAIVDHYPAERFDSSTRVTTDPDLVYSDSHNWVYCLFKHFGPAQRWVFLAYALLVGGGTRHGLLKWLLALPRGPLAATSQFWASTRGKLAGVRTYYGRRTEGPRQE